MNWQLVIVGLIVVSAAGYLMRASWRAWIVSKHGCSGGCGCQANERTESAANGRITHIDVEQLTVRLRENRQK